MAPSWLNDAVFYEIYPQSFYDSNGDGIGDIPGMTQKLDYIQSLGCNALWINPCYDSPFQDGGYDVRDYKKVAPRYGTNEDLLEFFRQAHARGFHVLLDLVPCHTSQEHPWFLDSSAECPGAYRDRYIWTDHWGKHPAGLPFVGGDRPRNGCYVISYFKCQPALNYGFANPTEPWQDAADSPNALATREALWDIMDFWLSRGCDGFRVDMASELVKGDGEDRACARAIYKDLKGRMDRKYPEAALVSEWSTPEWSLECGFDMDFYLDWPRMGTHYLLRNYEGLGTDGPLSRDRSYFKEDSGVSPMPFLEEYLPRYEVSRNNGLWCFLTCNHDTIRPRFNLTPEELKIAYCFVFTMPGAPYLYYGDEIGMRYRNLPGKEGGYTRTGSRTPMQWSKGANLGFSTAAPENLYLPVDPAEDAPTVQQQQSDPHSLLNHVKGLIALRRRFLQFGAYEPFEVYFARPDSRLLAYKRGSLLCAVNPGTQVLTLELDGAYDLVYSCGEARITGNRLELRGFGVMIHRFGDVLPAASRR